MTLQSNSFAPYPRSIVLENARRTVSVIEGERSELLEEAIQEQLGKKIGPFWRKRTPTREEARLSARDGWGWSCSWEIHRWVTLELAEKLIKVCESPGCGEFIYLSVDDASRIF